jgi:hypothetical protein
MDAKKKPSTCSEKVVNCWNLNMFLFSIIPTAITFKPNYFLNHFIICLDETTSVPPTKVVRKVYLSTDEISHRFTGLYAIIALHGDKRNVLYDNMHSGMSSSTKSHGGIFHAVDFIFNTDYNAQFLNV